MFHCHKIASHQLSQLYSQEGNLVNYVNSPDTHEGQGHYCEVHKHLRKSLYFAPFLRYHPSNYSCILGPQSLENSPHLHKPQATDNNSIGLFIVASPIMQNIWEEVLFQIDGKKDSLFFTYKNHFFVHCCKEKKNKRRVPVNGHCVS